MRTSVLGMGRMGQALAGRLLHGGHSVTVWNRSPGRAGDLTEEGAEEAASIAEAARSAEVVLTSLANDDAVREVALGPGGVRDSIGGGIYADASTISPSLSGELASAMPGFVALPLLGSPDTVRAGQAVFLPGAPDALVERMGPVLSSLSTTIHHYPEAPLASTAKLASNLVLLTGLLAVAEAAAVGRAGGLSDDQLRELFGDSPVVAPGIRNRLDAVLTGSGPTWWTTELGAKDAQLALRLGDQADVELPVTAAVRGRYEDSLEAGNGHEDVAAVTRLYRH